MNISAIVIGSSTYMLINGRSCSDAKFMIYHVFVLYSDCKNWRAENQKTIIYCFSNYSIGGIEYEYQFIFSIPIVSYHIFALLCSVIDTELRTLYFGQKFINFEIILCTIRQVYFHIFCRLLPSLLTHYIHTHLWKNLKKNFPLLNI